MSKKKKLIPELRFPEFKNEGEWSQIPIGNVLQESRIPSTVNDPSKRITVRLNQKGIEKREFRGTEAEDATYFFVRKKGQFIYGKQNLHKGAFGIIPDELDGFESSQDIPAFDFKKDYIPEYFVNYLGQEIIFPELEKLSIGTGSKRIHPKDLFKVEFPFPKKPEQKKIASCISSLDKVIESHNQKLELLKDHKKGLMQNLFPQEGEKVPKYRFKEFENDVDWVETVLEKVTDKIMVGIASAATHAYRKSGIILFRNQNIKEGYLDDRDILFIDEDYEKEHKNKRLKAGDLLTARTGYPGATCVVPDKYEGSQSFTTLITRPKQSVINSLFLSYYINSEKGQAFFNATKIGGGQQNVNVGSLIEMPILYPSKKEQQKIASCLSALDELITAQTEKIEQLKQHKKGLMQGLFPKIED